MRTQRCHDTGGLDCRVTGHIYRSTAHAYVVKEMTLRRTDSPDCTDNCLQLDSAGRCANEYPVVARQFPKRAHRDVNSISRQMTIATRSPSHSMMLTEEPPEKCQPSGFSSLGVSLSLSWLKSRPSGRNSHARLTYCRRGVPEVSAN